MYQSEITFENLDSNRSEWSSYRLCIQMSLSLFPNGYLWGTENAVNEEMV